MVLVDSNVLIDIFTRDVRWYDWSSEALLTADDAEGLAINPIIYAEVGAVARTRAEVERQFTDWVFARLPLPYEAGFLAGQAFVRYRREGGQRRSPLPDFYIGAHAQTAGLTLLTRDAARYRTYFPKLRLIAPE